MKLKIKIMIFSVMIIGFITAFTMLALKNSYYAIEVSKRESTLLEETKRLEAEKLAKERRQAELDDKRSAGVKYDVMNDYYSGLSLVKKGNKWGYIDYNENVVIDLQYDVANNFTSKLAKVRKNGKWGYINTEGKAIIPIEFYYCGEPSNGAIAVGNNGLYGFRDLSGKVICDLIYDRVEAFNENGIAKVVRDKKYGFIDKKGTVIIPIETPSNEENADFTGTWSRTNTHSSLASSVKIYGQMATSFEFELNSKYYHNKGNVSGMADITSTNSAVYKFNSGNVQDEITFTVIDGLLNITAKNDGNMEMGADVSPVGVYTLESPTYTNENVVKKLFDNKELERIEQVLGEDVYENEFIYALKNGLYKKMELDKASLFKGKLYQVWVPTLDKDYKILIGDKYIYFFSKAKEIYKTDDPDRESVARMPSIISFDEL